MGVLRSSAFIGRCEIDTHAILVKSPVLPWSTSPASIVSTNVRIFQGSVHGIRADFHFGPTPGAGTLGLLAPIPTSVIPANGDLCVTPVVGDSVAEMASIPGGEPPTLDSRLRGNDGPRRPTPQSSFPKQRASTVATSSFPRRRAAAHPNRHSREGGNPRRGPAMGSRLHGNDGRRRRTPQSSFPKQRESTAATSSFPRRRESTAGGRRWVPVSTGTTSRRRRTPQSSFPQQRESTAATSSFPRRRESIPDMVRHHDS